MCNAKGVKCLLGHIDAVQTRLQRVLKLHRPTHGLSSYLGNLLSFAQEGSQCVYRFINTERGVHIEAHELHKRRLSCSQENLDL